MKLYHLSQEVNKDYDTYDSCVVCALSEEDAKLIQPDGGKYQDYEWMGVWVNDLKDIKVVYLGEASEDLKRGVICASFNAG